LAGYVLCFLSSLVWLIAAFQSNIYTYSPAPYIGMLARGFVFATITFLMMLYQDTSRRSQQQLERLRRILPICPNCGRMLCVDGQWRHLDDILNNIPANALTPSCDCSH
jgi:hypothetical protein